jgi:hypothetical protein
MASSSLPFLLIHHESKSASPKYIIAVEVGLFAGAVLKFFKT